MVVLRAPGCLINNRLEATALLLNDKTCSVVVLVALSAKNTPSDPLSQINIAVKLLFPNENTARNVRRLSHLTRNVGAKYKKFSVASREESWELYINFFNLPLTLS